MPATPQVHAPSVPLSRDAMSSYAVLSGAADFCVRHSAAVDFLRF